MIAIIAQAWIQSMKRIPFSIVLLLIVAQARLSAQETAAGGQAAPPSPVPTNQPSGLLTPPPDNAPSVAPAPMATVPPASAPANSTGATAAKTPPSTKMSPHEI